jgi:hypothetical protein
MLLPAVSRPGRSSRAGFTVLELLLLAALGGGCAWWTHDRAALKQELAAERQRRAAAVEREVEAALKEAEALREQGKKLHDDPAKWQTALTGALAAVRRAEAVLDVAGDRDGPLGRRVFQARELIEKDEFDRRLFEKLERFRVLVSPRDGK